MSNIVAFFSDPHFGHTKVLEERGFGSVAEMDEALVNNYNKQINFDDTVVWLGDCFFHHDLTYCRNILTEMSGTKVLVLGNHDRTATSMARMGFSLVVKEALMEIAGHPCRVSHFPYGPVEAKGENRKDKFADKRPRRQPGEFLIHGHSHSKTRFNGDQVNACVDAWNFGPLMLCDVARYIRLIRNETIHPTSLESLEHTEATHARQTNPLSEIVSDTLAYRDAIDAGLHVGGHGKRR